MRLLEGDAGWGWNQALTLAALHRCVRACGDTERRYAHAAAHVRSRFLHFSFQMHARQRTEFIAELADFLPGLGSDAHAGDPLAVFSTNRGVSPSASVRYDEDVILDEVIRAETAASRTYAAVGCVPLDMPGLLRSTITAQQEAIQNALRVVWAYATEPRRRR